ncbi:MAG TPA: hypothetical protein VHA37_00865 [Candidatus Saccharimonadales bacterium]|nr:hypothetical protein [Candidatus Saccharimonadales bacterium]
MTDNGIAERIAEVLVAHVEDGLTNYDTERNECGCGDQKLSETYRQHVAAVLVRELGLTEFTTPAPIPERWWSTGIQQQDAKGDWQWPK